MIFLEGESKESGFPGPLRGHGGSSQLSAPAKTGFLRGAGSFPFYSQQNKEQNQLSKLNNERTPFSTLYILMLIKHMKSSQRCGRWFFWGAGGGAPTETECQGRPAATSEALRGRLGDVWTGQDPCRHQGTTPSLSQPLRPPQGDAVGWAAYNADGYFSPHSSGRWEAQGQGDSGSWLTDGVLTWQSKTKPSLLSLLPPPLPIPLFLLLLFPHPPLPSLFSSPSISLLR